MHREGLHVAVVIKDPGTRVWRCWSPVSWELIGNYIETKERLRGPGAGYSGLTRELMISPLGVELVGYQNRNQDWLA